MKIQLLMLTLAALMLASCNEETKEETVITGVSTEKYNRLVEKHNELVDRNNKLVTTGNKSSNSYYTYMHANLKMNAMLELFSSTATEIINMREAIKFGSLLDQKVKDRVDSLMVSFKDLYDEGVAAIVEAQSQMMRQHNALLRMAPSVYKNGTRHLKRLEQNNKMALSLDGIMAQHKALYAIVVDIVNTEMKGSAVTANPSVSGTTTNTVIPVKPAREIELSQDEQFVAETKTDGSGVFISNSGQVESYSSERFKSEARALGFGHDVINHSQEIAKSFDGVVGMACTERGLVSVMNNLVSHMKAKANKNSDDLEIVMAIDYSGSMENNIRKVLTELDQFMSSLINVHNSGRKIRFGIVTFGKPGLETIELSLTGSVAKVQKKLGGLLKKFNGRKHSTNPGEASFYGLKLAGSQKMGWSSKNRQIILITDEPSYSLATGDRSFVRQVKRELSQMNIYPLMVKLCN